MIFMKMMSWVIMIMKTGDGDKKQQDGSREEKRGLYWAQHVS